MADPKNDPKTVSELFLFKAAQDIDDRVLRLLKQPMRSFVASPVGRPWSVHPAGFNFVGRNLLYLRNLLIASPDFGHVTWSMDLRGHPPNTESFREVGKPDSLHIHLSGYVGGMSIAHLDSVSIARAKAPDGSVIYNDNANVALNHAFTDLWRIKDRVR